MGNSSFFRLKTSKINFSLYLLGDKYKIDEDKFRSELLPYFTTDCFIQSLLQHLLLRTKFESESTHE